jgi:hypothetical protein
VSLPGLTEQSSSMIGAYWITRSSGAHESIVSVNLIERRSNLIILEVRRKASVSPKPRRVSISRADFGRSESLAASSPGLSRKGLPFQL